MRRGLRVVGRLLFALIVAAMFAPYVLPPFLDRIYYRGPVSGHFDGQRFFNPDGMAGHQQTGGGMQGPTMFRFLMGADREPWPKSVPVRPTKPPATADGVECAVPTTYTAAAGEDAVEAALRATWIGHATALVQVGPGFTILTDPIWSERASPVAFAGPKRVREPGIRFDDLPKIDLVLISHNHYDHLDVPTLRRLWQRDRPLIVTSLGNDAVLRAEGIPAVARDWGGRVRIPGRFGVDCNHYWRQPAEVIVDRVHHWGSRWSTDRNRALWSGFTVVLPGGNLFFAGDTGPGDMTWADEAARHGPVRLALIPIGAFRPRQLMSGNHLGPPEAVEAFRRLGAANALGIHWGTFQLTSERIDEPRQYLAAALERAGIPAERFRATEVGVGWDVPPLPAQASSAATSSSPSAMPNRSVSAAR